MGPINGTGTIRSLPFDYQMELASAETSLSSPQVQSYSHHQPNIDQTSLSVRSSETHTSIITSLSSSRVTSRRGQLALLEAIARSIYRGNPVHETLQCNQTYIERCTNESDEGNVGSIVRTSQARINSAAHPRPSYMWAFHHFYLSGLLQHILPNFVERPIHTSFMLTHDSSAQSVATPQLGEVPSISSEEVALHNRSDLLGQQSIWSALFTNRLEGGILEGSSSLRMLTDGNVGPIRLSFEDILILCQPSVYHISNPHDQHEDMRLDVDNMSYEELLALEDRIGNVNTGLGEEMVIRCLKHSKCVLSTEKGISKESCSICQEEYAEEDEIGTLGCDHYFHITCIKKWLRYKNVCPICKSIGLTTSDTHFPTSS
ncbi:E3 ubiquitin-protein ligase MBR2-like [Magnolia sinica]|uniref:E3 ubiquitin-protein ligase MBR2-like n=1 Tax=Magnolia sinica TaxID=86752 RepID=UPI002657FDD9|nr:E3 ubiquitin-protein ligase MBR2-like [Magnolia sinica]